MRILVIGAGAIGTLLAGCLASGGNEVAVVLRNRPPSLHVASVMDAEGNRVASAEVRSYPGTAVALDGFRPELSILAVKGYATESVIREALEGKRKPGGLFMTVQNGIGNEEALVNAFGSDAVISGIITSPVERIGDLEVRRLKRGILGIAPVSPGKSIEEISALFEQAGFEVQIFGDYRSMKWSKLMMNMIGNALPAIVGWPPEAVFGNRRLAEVEVRALKETVAVMKAYGIRPVRIGRYPLPLLSSFLGVLPTTLLAVMMKPLVARGRGGKRPSLQIDLMMGKRQSEVEFLNGAVVNYGRAEGVPVPVNSCITETLASMFDGKIPRSFFDGDPERLLERCRDYEQKEAKRQET